MPGFNINGTGGELSGTYETARSHRWRVTVTKFRGDRDVILAAKSAGRPAPEIAQNTIHHKQTEIYWPGKHKWSPVSMTFYELVDDNNVNMTASAMFNWWAREVIDTRTNNINNDWHKQITVEQLAGNGGGEYTVPAVWSYSLLDAWPFKVEPSELDYSLSDLSTVRVDFRYNMAVEE